LGANQYLKLYLTLMARHAPKIWGNSESPNQHPLGRFLAVIAGYEIFTARNKSIKIYIYSKTKKPGYKLCELLASCPQGQLAMCLRTPVFGQFNISLRCF